MRDRRWSSDDERQVARAFVDMFTIFGGGSPERIASYSDVLQQEVDCPTCVVLAIQKLLLNVTRVPSPKLILEAYGDVYGASHVNHIAESTKATAVGKVEAFWRRDAVRVITAFMEERDIFQANIIAAEMWWTRSVEANVDAVYEEMTDDRDKAGWMSRVGYFLSQEDPEGVLKVAWERNRYMETYGEAGLPENLVQLRPKAVVG